MATRFTTYACCCVFASALAVRGDDDAPQRSKSAPETGGTSFPLFERLDKDGDGKLSNDEIPARLRERMSAIDRNGDGVIDREEFRAVVERLAGAAAAGKNRFPGERISKEKPAKPKEGGAAPKDSDAPAAPEKSAKRKKAAKGKDAGMPDPGVVFGRLDRNGDGKLAVEELPAAMREQFSRMDADGDGFISKDEFARAAAIIRRLRERQEQGGFAGRGTPRDLFNQQDADADGRITKAEAKGVLLERFAELDRDKDDKLSLLEVESGLKANPVDSSKPKDSGNRKSNAKQAKSSF